MWLFLKKGEYVNVFLISVESLSIIPVQKINTLVLSFRPNLNSALLFTATFSLQMKKKKNSSSEFRRHFSSMTSPTVADQLALAQSFQRLNMMRFTLTIESFVFSPLGG